MSESVLTIFVCVLFGLCLAVATVMVLLVLRIRRRLRELRRSRTVVAGALRIRMLFADSARRREIALCLRLNAILASADEAAASLDRALWPIGELRMLLERLQTEGHRLEAQLDFVKASPAEPATSGRLDQIEGHVDDLEAALTRIRRALNETLDFVGVDDAERVLADANREGEALDAGLARLAAFRSEGPLKTSPPATSRRKSSAGDPHGVLDAGYDHEVELLLQLRRRVADVATALRRLELEGREPTDRQDGLLLAELLTQLDDTERRATRHVEMLRRKKETLAATSRAPIARSRS